MTIEFVGRDLEPDIRSEILRLLPIDASNREVSNRIAGMRTTELFTRFLNWRSRLVRPVRRRVHYSSDLLKNPASFQFLDVLAVIEAKASRGESLLPHLSKGIQIGVAPQPPKKNLANQSDLDLLLNDWGIHHLHLSLKLERQFVARTKDLLFARFTDFDCYLIDIMPHGSWSNEKLVQTVVRNWPAANLFLAMNGFQSAEQEISTHDRAQLRKAGVNSAVQIDGRSYLPRTGGLTTAGTSTQTYSNAAQFFRYLGAICDQSNGDPQWLPNQMAQAPTPFPTDPSFAFEMLDPWNFVLVERRRKHAIPVN